MSNAPSQRVACCDGAFHFIYDEAENRLDIWRSYFAPFASLREILWSLSVPNFSTFT